MGRFMSATGQFLMATYGQFSCPPTGSFRCPLTLVFEGNTPRIPRMTIMPYTTMLYRRLTGTTDGSGFYRNTHQTPAPHPPAAPEGGPLANAKSAATFSVPTEGPAKRPWIALSSRQAQDSPA